MPGMGIMVVASAAAALFTLVHTLLTLPNFFQTLKAIMFTGPVVILQMAFPNIFAVSAYENGYTNKPTAFAAATAGMTQNEINGITQADFEGIRLHTLFFIGWMTAVILDGTLFWQHLGKIRNTRFWPKNDEGCCTGRDSKVLEWCTFLLFFFGIPIFNIKLIVDLYEPKVSGDRFTYSSQSTQSINQSLLPSPNCM